MPSVAAITAGDEMPQIRQEKIEKLKRSPCLKVFSIKQWKDKSISTSLMQNRTRSMEEMENRWTEICKNSNEEMEESR